jgi:hypothetical protein
MNNSHCNTISKVFSRSQHARDCPIYFLIMMLIDESEKDDFRHQDLSAEEIDSLLNYLFSREEDLLWIDEVQAGGLPDYHLSHILNRLRCYLNHVQYSCYFRRASVLLINQLVRLLNESFQIEDYEIEPSQITK